jgi:hypothetical protein
MSAPLDPELVAERLEALRRVCGPVYAEEARSWFEGEAGSSGAVSERAGFAKLVQERLDELRALCELAEYLRAAPKG